MADIASPISLVTGRFERFAAVKWWDQSRLRAAKVLVVGAGALGNEVVKNLSLVGVGHLAVADMDRVEESNLTRSILFRGEDEGQFKAEVICRAARRLYPDVQATALVGNILGDVGLGWFRWADIVVGALDNREARVFVNSTCATLGRTWIDGGIDMLNGIVRGFSPPLSACYECTMSQTDWDLINKRRSCSLLARQALQEGGAPTSPTTASVIGAMQAQEVVKYLHGMDILLGEGFLFEGRTHGSYRVSYPIKNDCPWHEAPPPVQSFPQLSSDVTFRQLWNLAAQQLGPLDALDLGHEIITNLQCTSCGATRRILQPLHKVTDEHAVCTQCGAECRADFAASISADSPWLDVSIRQFGLPAWDIIWARAGSKLLGIEIAADQVHFGGTVCVSQ